MSHPVTFTVPAGLQRTDEILALDKHIQSLGKNVRIHAYDTLQGLLWNGGRLLFNRKFLTDENSPMLSRLTDENMGEALLRIRKLNDAGIPFHFVFNSTLESVDTDDEACNYLLQQAHNEMNGVTVASEALRSHISAAYPNYSLTASICFAHLKPEPYKAACEKYDKVVVMPTLAYEPELLEGLPVDKLVFIINDQCYLFCVRKDHYDHISRCWSSGNSTLQEQKLNATRAACFIKDPRYRSEIARKTDPAWMANIERIRSEHVKADQIGEKNLEYYFTITPTARKNLIRMGVCNFKLQGREYIDKAFQEKVKDFLEKVVREEL